MQCDLAVFQSSDHISAFLICVFRNLYISLFRSSNCHCTDQTAEIYFGFFLYGKCNILQFYVLNALFNGKFFADNAGKVPITCDHHRSSARFFIVFVGNIISNFPGVIFTFFFWINVQNFRLHSLSLVEIRSIFKICLVIRNICKIFCITCGNRSPFPGAIVKVR